MPHIVLLGDSVFDNAAYVDGGPDVVRQLRDAVGERAQATLLAVDGAVTTDMPRQLARLPADATHLVVSVGGNDALRHIGILQEPARSVAEVLDMLRRIADLFERDYRAAIAPLVALGKPLTICTIYDGWLEPEELRRRASTALMVFNDVVLRVALGSGASIIDLRATCCDAADYANPIEPSVIGGAKIARAIVRATLSG